MLHRTHELLIRQRTMLINALRAHLAKFGIVMPQGRAGVGGHHIEQLWARAFRSTMLGVTEKGIMRVVMSAIMVCRGESHNSLLFCRESYAELLGVS